MSQSERQGSVFLQEPGLKRVRSNPKLQMNHKGEICKLKLSSSVAIHNKFFFITHLLSQLSLLVLSLHTTSFVILLLFKRNKSTISMFPLPLYSFF